DEALGLPTQRAVTIALRTQQVLAHETGVGDTVDPLAGSYYVEALTDQLEAEARTLLARIDELGGAVPAIEAGFPQREIADAAYRTQRAIESGDQVVVGVNRFRDDERQPIPIQRVAEQVRARQVERTRAVREARDATRWARAMDGVEHAARGDENLVGAILEAVLAYATVGEIAGRLAGVFGRYQDTAI
nr:methylmalonyl-CoA mutase family protein [Acidobacteriota bacterium]